MLIKPATVLSREAFTNADWVMRISERRSTNCLAMFFRSNLVQWGSKKQKVVALFSTKVEYKVVSQASIEIAWL